MFLFEALIKRANGDSILIVEFWRLTAPNEWDVSTKPNIVADDRAGVGRCFNICVYDDSRDRLLVIETNPMRSP